MVAGSQDYNETSTTVEFGPGGTQTESIVIPLIDDDIVESPEVFFVSLTIPDDESGISIPGNRSTAMVTVQDDDSKSVSLTLYQLTTHPCSMRASLFP